MTCKDGKCGTRRPTVLYTKPGRLHREPLTDTELQMRGERDSERRAEYFREKEKQEMPMYEEPIEPKLSTDPETPSGTVWVTIPSESPYEPIMQFFTYDHLPEHLQAISKPFTLLADQIMLLPRNQERTVALRFLLQSKDAAVRAKIVK